MVPRPLEEPEKPFSSPKIMALIYQPEESDITALKKYAWNTRPPSDQPDPNPPKPPLNYVYAEGTKSLVDNFTNHRSDDTISTTTLPSTLMPKTTPTHSVAKTEPVIDKTGIYIEFRHVYIDRCYLLNVVKPITLCLGLYNLILFIVFQLYVFKIYGSHHR